MWASTSSLTPIVTKTFTVAHSGLETFSKRQTYLFKSSSFREVLGCRMLLAIKETWRVVKKMESSVRDGPVMEQNNRLFSARRQITQVSLILSRMMNLS